MARNYDPLQEWEDYVPDIVGDDGVRERTRFEEDPDNAIVVEIKTLSKRECERFSERALRAGRQGKEAAKKELRSMMAETVRNVRNYSTSGRPILTGEDMADLGDFDICEDVMDAVMRRPLLERGLAKKLRSPSATPSLPPTKRRGGDAADVQGGSSQGGRPIPIPMTPSCNSTTPPSDGSATATATVTSTSPGLGHQG